METCTTFFSARERILLKLIISGVQEIVLFGKQTMSNNRLFACSTHVLNTFSCSHAFNVIYSYVK